MSLRELEYHIPIPPKKVEIPYREPRRPRFADMVPGSSRFFPAKTPAERQAIALSAHSYARRQDPRWEMHTRKRCVDFEWGLRVWRIK